MPLRKPVMNARSFAEGRRNRFDERRIERLREVETLDRDRRVHPFVEAAVDDAELALTDELLDAELAVEDIPLQIEGIFPVGFCSREVDCEFPHHREFSIH